MISSTEINADQQININFHRGKIITRLVLGLLFITFISFCLVQSFNSVKPIFLFLILVSFHILIFHGLAHLNQFRNGKTGLELNNKGIFNNTADTSLFIPWTEVEEFQTGFYRANQQIVIKVRDVNKYHHIKRTAYLTLINRIGLFFRSKPDLLWIDVNLLDINEKQLLNLLHSKRNEIKAG